MINRHEKLFIFVYNGFVMDIQAKRIELAKWILDVGEDLLNKVNAIKENSSSEIIVYSVSGEPLTKEVYVKKIKEAEARIESGQFTSHDDLLKEMQDW
ncbi:hypothetical protein [Tenacibaculum agarivorans]|uniref:hypothetical protein n=1 Tax=Tenacibaculum agarivorans TaxID=1908389 RepID=UPI00117D9406|nr:hypothetical protein [Tenacibaculum agarivorans]